MTTVKFKPGDIVTPIRPPAHDKVGQPWQRPRQGEVYTITATYRMKYGIGCQLEGMNPSPYKGYLLYVRPGQTMIKAREGWYFRKVEPVDIKKVSKNHADLENELAMIAAGYDKYGKVDA